MKMKKIMVVLFVLFIFGVNNGSYAVAVGILPELIAEEECTRISSYITKTIKNRYGKEKTWGIRITTLEKQNEGLTKNDIEFHIKFCNVFVNNGWTHVKFEVIETDSPSGTVTIQGDDTSVVSIKKVKRKYSTCKNPIPELEKKKIHILLKIDHDFGDESLCLSNRIFRKDDFFSKRIKRKKNLEKFFQEEVDRTERTLYDLKI